MKEPGYVGVHSRKRRIIRVHSKWRDTTIKKIEVISPVCVLMCAHTFLGPDLHLSGRVTPSQR